MAIKKDYFASHPEDEMKAVVSNIRDFMDIYCTHEGLRIGPVTIFNFTFSCHQVQLTDAEGV